MSDYIKREDAKKWLTNLREDCGRYQDLWHYAEALDQIIELLSVDVAPVRHGRWIDKGDGAECSICGSFWKYDGLWDRNGFIRVFRYCETCGARMDEETDA